MEALYDGWCAGCGERIYEGDDITMTDAGAQHEDCAPLPDEPVTFPL